MTLLSFMQILVVIAAITGGQILFKIAATTAAGGLAGLAVSPAMIAALAVYAAATLLWVHVIKTTPLSVAYPLVSLTLAFVPVAGALFFGEALVLKQGIGIAVILLGVAIVYI